MADEHGTLQRIDWGETFPFTRLFSTFRRAISIWPLMLGLTCVLLTYFAGRIMDGMWIESGAHVLKASEAPAGTRAGYRAGRITTFDNEIEAYASLDAATFQDWVKTQRHALESAKLQSESPDNAFETQEIDAAYELIDARVEAGLKRIEADAELDPEDKEAARNTLYAAADVVRFELAGENSSVLGSDITPNGAAVVLLKPDLQAEKPQGADELTKLRLLMGKCRVHADYANLKKSGPFIALLDYESKCFAAAIQGVCSARFGFSGSALSHEPSMLGSIASAGNGAFWLATQRPCFFVIFTLVLLVLFALFGGAICRTAAVRSAREEGVSYKQALKFSCGKFSSMTMAVLMPVIAFVVIAVSVWIGGLIAAIPGLQVITGIVYWLSLIGGFVLALIVILSITGFHLMWPTIAVEGSDAFDAIQRSYGYVMQKPWNTAFYSFVLLIYGGLSFVFVRLLAALTLKLSHVFTGAGMNLAAGANADTVGKLDAMWRMPTWQDLPLLPATGDVNFWGDLVNAPMSGVEAFTFFFFALFIFMIVGMVGGFVVSFYFCGATEMYYLLRCDVDSIDYEEIYYEELEDEFDYEFEDEAGEASEEKNDDSEQDEADGKDAEEK